MAGVVFSDAGAMVASARPGSDTPYGGYGHDNSRRAMGSDDIIRRNSALAALGYFAAISTPVKSLSHRGKPA